MRRLQLALFVCGALAFAACSSGGGGGKDGGAGKGGHGGTGGTGGATGGTGGATGGTGGATGGSTGTGGQGGAGGQSCTALATLYADAMNQARMCNAAATTDQCTHLVLASLTCTCQTWVNDSTTLDAIHTLYTQAGCTTSTCPVACVNPGTHGACMAINSGDFCGPGN